MLSYVLLLSHNTQERDFVSHLVVILGACLTNKREVVERHCAARVGGAESLGGTEGSPQGVAARRSAGVGERGVVHTFCSGYLWS
jgi:hypothetical protein